MTVTVHEIDPNADTIIVLRNACTSFAPWESDAVGNVESTFKNPEEADGNMNVRGDRPFRVMIQLTLISSKSFLMKHTALRPVLTSFRPRICFHYIDPRAKTPLC